MADQLYTSLLLAKPEIMSLKIDGPKNLWAHSDHRQSSNTDPGPCVNSYTFIYLLDDTEI